VSRSTYGRLLENIDVTVLVHQPQFTAAARDLPAYCIARSSFTLVALRTCVQ
jgi:hypothetical protein